MAEWQTYNTENIKGDFLFKFLSEKHLLSFLKSGDIWLSRSDKFGDKMECVMIKDLQKPKPDFAEIEARKRKHLISCFHEGTRETLAFWDTYAKNDDERRKFALRFDREDFITRIEMGTSSIVVPEKITALIHGKVKYKNLIGSKLLEKHKVKHPAFRKEYSFAYEREYRFVVRLNEESKALGYSFNIGKPTSMKFSILINPLLENEDYLNCINVIENSGFETKFQMSALTKWLKPELWK